MYTLGVNTALQTSAICLCKDGEIVKEKTWNDQRRESELLLPAIVEMCEGIKIDDVLVVKGPGPFTGIRIGVVTANAMAQNMEAVSLHAISTFELLDSMAAGNEYDSVILNAGGRTIFVYKNNFVETVQIEDLKDKKVVADLTEKQLELIDMNIVIEKNLLSFAQVCAKMSAGEDYEKYLVEDLPLLPYYVKEPSITL